MTEPQKTFATRILNALEKQTQEAILKRGSIVFDPEECKARRLAAAGLVRACAVPPFSPDAIASDAALGDRLKKCRDRIDHLVSKRDVLYARLTSALEISEQLARPQNSLRLVFAASVGVFALCFAPTIYSTFLYGTEDPLVGWIVSVVLGVSLGAFLSGILIGSQEESCN